MIKKPYILAVALLVTGVVLSACIVEYDFSIADPWRTSGGALARGTDLTGSAQGWGGTVRVTLNLVMGQIENVRIDARHETPSRTRELIQIAERNAVILNSFDFLDGMSGNTLTRVAIREAGNEAIARRAVFPGDDDDDDDDYDDDNS